MARMLPPRPYEDATASEKWIFSQLQDDQALSEWTVLHSLGLARHRRKSFAECDFVLVGPAGVYCLEVKGGRVTREEGIWKIGWPGKQYTSTEGPFKQAQSARGALLDEVRSRLGGEILQRVPFGWGVAFPDIAFGRVDPECSRESIYDVRDTDQPFSRYLARLAAYTRRHEAERGRTWPVNVTPADSTMIVRTLRPDFDLVPSMKRLIRESRQDLLSLTAEQFIVLDTLVHDNNRRVICVGGAGTGKTLLACEAARRHAAAGARVLFLCYNRNLAWHLKRNALHRDRGVTVATAWKLLTSIVKQADPRAALPDNYDSDQLADQVEEAVLQLLDKEKFVPYDVLVIDEAQDVLSSGFMRAADLLIDGGMSNGRWNLFLDRETQAAIYSKLDDELDSHLSSLAVTVPLSLNLRNPAQIAHEAAVYAGVHTPLCRRQFGRPVDYRTIKTAGNVRHEARVLLTELMKSDVAPSDIILLSMRRPSDAFFAGGFGEIGRKVALLDGSQADIAVGDLCAASVPAFKGLEGEVVIVGDVPEPPLDAWQRASLYVALTRATTAAYILAPAGLVDYRLGVLEREAV